MADKDKAEDTSRKRRVSFMPDPKVDYIYRDRIEDDEHASDMTLFCYEENEDSSYNINELDLDNIFNNKEKFPERTFLEYEEQSNKEVCANSGVGGRMSLDPLKYSLLGEIVDDVDDNPQKDLLLAKSEVDGNMLQIDGSNYKNVKDELDEGDDLNANSSNYCNVNNDAGTSNDGNASLLNTSDFRISSKSVKSINIDEYFANLGIRFLDKIISEMGRRETISKSTNRVDISLKIYVEYSRKERVIFLNNCSKFLNNKMEELQRQIRNKQQDCSTASLINDITILKRLRNEARNRSKIEWYQYRRIQELQFNKIICENKNKLIFMLHELKRKKEEKDLEKEEILRMVAKEIQKKEEINSCIMKRNRGIAISINNDLEDGNCNSIMNIDLNDVLNITNSNTVGNNDLLNSSNPILSQIQSKVIDHKRILQNIKKEYEEIQKHQMEKEMEIRIIGDRLEILKGDISKLNNQIYLKSVDEGQLSEMKNRANSFENIFGVKLLKIRIKKIHSSELTLEVCGFEFTCKLCDNIIVEYSVKSNIRDSFTEFVKDCIKLSNQSENATAPNHIVDTTTVNNTSNIQLNANFGHFSTELNNNSSISTRLLTTQLIFNQKVNLKSFIYRIIHTIYILNGLRKEVEQLEEKFKVESFYSNNKYHIKIIPESRVSHVFFIKSNLEIEVDETIEDIKECKSVNICADGNSICEGVNSMKIDECGDSRLRAKINLFNDLGGLSRFVYQMMNKRVG